MNLAESGQRDAKGTHAVFVLAALDVRPGGVIGKGRSKGGCLTLGQRGALEQAAAEEVEMSVRSRNICLSTLIRRKEKRGLEGSKRAQ